MQQLQGDTGSLKGKKVAISGDFKPHKQKDVQEIIERLGATYSEKVVKGTDLLIQGSEKKGLTNKTKLAIEYKVPICRTNLKWLEKQYNQRKNSPPEVKPRDPNRTRTQQSASNSMCTSKSNRQPEIHQGTTANKSCIPMSTTVANTTTPLFGPEICNGRGATDRQVGPPSDQTPAGLAGRFPAQAPRVVLHGRYEDDDGHFIGSKTEVFDEKYKLGKALGSGTYGKVFGAVNVRNGSLAAIKVSRAGEKYRHFVSSEIRVLKTIKANGGNDKKQFVNLLDNFECLGHQFLVFELLSVSLYDFLVDNRYAPFPNSQIQSVTRQILAGLTFLEDLKIIHGDLKPDNIVVCNKQYQTFTYDRTVVSTLSKKHYKIGRRVLLNPEIRLIDFGLAFFDDEPNKIRDTALVYCAPEVRLRRGSSFPRDMWSLACLILQLRTGKVAFGSRYLPSYIARVEAVTGSKIDDAWLNETGQGINFDSTHLESSREELKTLKINDLDQIVSNEKDNGKSSFMANFPDLIKKMLIFNPAHRITPRQALEHVWVTSQAPPDDGTLAAEIRR